MLELEPPSIDLKHQRIEHGSQEWDAAAITFDKALRMYGVVYVENTGIPSNLLDEVRSKARMFFLSTKPKVHLSMYGPEGYNPVGQENVASSVDTEDVSSELDVVESVVIRKGGDACPECLREPALKYAKECHRVLNMLLRLMAHGIGAEEDDTLKPFAVPNNTLKLSHYPPKGKTNGYGAHRDFSGFTLLSQEASGEFPKQGALHVLVENEWRLVRPRPNCILVNAGELIHRWTNGRYVAPLHQVVLAENRTVGRLSVVYFTQPLDEVVIHPLKQCIENDEEPRFEPISAGEWIKRKIQLTNAT